jgi:flavin reductase (DIM6/NTAB) family NADH-FMN oxidoreductase RutF
MKHEVGVERQSHFKEPWPNAHQIFSWMEYAISVPYPTYLITTLKENGRPNACWHSWGCFSGDAQGYRSLIVVARGGHTYDNILRTREWCINLPTLQQQEQCRKTIEYNGIDNDEITDAGFTVEAPRLIRSPRIAECLVNMECVLEWHRPLFEGGCQHVFVGKVVHVAMDDRACEIDVRKRLETLDTMFNVMSTLDPLTGETGSDGLGIVRLP